MSCERRKNKRRKGLSARIARSYALLFFVTLAVLSALVLLLSRYFLIERQKSETAESVQSIAKLYCEELLEGHSPDDPELLRELNTNALESVVLLDADGVCTAQAGNFDLIPEEIPACADASALYTQSDGLPLIACGASPDADGAPGRTLVLLRRMDREYAFLKMLSLLLLGLNVVGGLAALASGGYATRKMLRPISDMIARARAIDARDLSARLEVPEPEDELRRLAVTINEMLERVEHAFERQGQFVQDASHELRTPLAVIQGNAELLDRWGKDDPATRDRCILAIRRQVEYMRRLVENLLFLARGDSGKSALSLEAVDARAFFDELIEERRLLDPARRYALELEPELKLWADRALLRQLLVILCDNAAKYAPEGGQVLLSASRSGNGVELSVSDDGPGVDEDQLERIFERFYRVDKARSRATGGSGLGLSIAKSIAELHGGTIHAERAQIGGLRVVARLPAYTDGAAR